MSTKLLAFSPSKQGRSRRRSSEGVHHETPVSQSFETSDGRDGLHSFLHRDLRISSEVSDFYCNSLIENGYDDVASLQDATEHDLKELGVKIGHVRRIKRAVFSNCMMSERLSSGGPTRGAPHSFANEISDESVVSKKSIDGSLLSDYARQEMSSRERSVDMDLASAKELLIRKQAEKIQTLEAKLSNAGINISHNGDHDELLSHISRSSRGGGSADTYSKKLSPEERLEQHRQKKLLENKYQEKTGVWDAPPLKKKEKSLTKKVSENNDLVLKLTSDATHRKKIDEDEKKAKKQYRKSLGVDAFDRSRPDLSPGYKQDRDSSSRRSSRGEGNSSFRQSSRGEGNSSFSANRQHHRTPCCDTCGSTRDCEPDVDNLEIFYCKSCWDKYEEDFDEPEVQSVQSQVVRQLVQNHTIIEDDPTHHALWITHDNPQLGDKIVYSGPRRMVCMLETKEPGKKNCVRIVIGDIDFSGKVKHAGIGNVDGCENEVGTECIRMRNVKGYCVDQKQVATRLSRDKSIIEFQLRDENAQLLTGKSASKSVGDFFKGCNGAIDVILDPQEDSGGWYPQREACNGGRKIAPQFRSKGVGYIRLGDDMSENGLAFLSSTACLTFLSSVSSSMKGPPPKKALPPTAKSSSKKREGSEKSGKTNSFRQQQPSQQCESDDDSSDDESVEEVQKVAEVLKDLQSPEMQSSKKWKDRAELLSLLGKGASKQDGQHSRSAALNVIQDTLGAKNGNVHVIRSSLIAAGMIGVAMGGELGAQISWKTIMIETLKLLKSKQCGSVAKTVLAQLHGRCFTLANSMECVSHVLGAGKLSASAGKGKQSLSAPKPRNASANGGNSIEVIEWLAETTERERSMEVIDPMLDRNGLGMLINLFFSYADHRDQRCRKNVMDGLMHCVLYGVQRLEMDLSRVMKMFSGLKETNKKGWDQIISNVKVVLGEEQR
eukprot:CAMPEP_0172306562 /NCGR_PEP_ID=MMETSP1058-20130122/7615_1 /TAXON_ID=83371 /ORGANISM="Detonula confervacea, Strain CCMP 353" /LENGTH=943 /DNA_ID=CAMNT_0013018491 /DNA_START=223 /DNA_END=3054 /DNA_ORIENTATION=+